MQDLKNKHKNQTAWIIGSGPSLEHLTQEDIGDGPVITLNTAIIAVEPLNLSNPVYSMQKDGGSKRRRSTANGGDNLSPDCDHRSECGVECGVLTMPKKATLLLHDLESKYCFSDYHDRYVLNLKELGLPKNVFSLIFAVKAAQYMGCDDFKFISCDAHTIGDMRTYIPGKGIFEENYLEQIGRFKIHLIGIPHEFITPGRWDKEVKVDEKKFIEYIEDMKIMKLKKGDVVFVRVNHPIAAEVAVSISKGVSEKLPKGINVIVFDSAADIGVMRAGS